MNEFMNELMGLAEQSQEIMRKWRLACLVLLQPVHFFYCLNVPSKLLQLEMALFPSASLETEAPQYNTRV